MDVTRHFKFEKAPRRISDLETPVPVIDLAAIDRNLKSWQSRCSGLGMASRPHVKTHKMVALALYQLDLGARGITVQMLGEAEVMADAGITDILLTYNTIGQSKLERLAALARRSAIAVVADNAVVVAGLGEAAKAAGRDLRVLVECDTGAGRNGVQTAEAAVDLALLIARTPGLRYGGLMTYPKAGQRRQAAAFLAEALERAERAGLATETVSSGGTPDMWKDEGLDQVDEYRVGTNTFYDRSNLVLGNCTEADCALTILTTVVSRPTAGRVILDAGSKALTSDFNGLTGHGVIRGHADASIYALSEEHGWADCGAHPTGLAVGEIVRVIPNHVCPTVNLFDRVAVAMGDEVLGYARVDARGRVT